MSKCRQFFTE